MTNVCAHYCGTVICIAHNVTEEQANKIMSKIFMLREPDGDVGDEGEWIYPDEMFTSDEVFIKEESLPFIDSDEDPFVYDNLDDDEIPF